MIQAGCCKIKTDVARRIMACDGTEEPFIFECIDDCGVKRYRRFVPDIGGISFSRNDAEDLKIYTANCYWLYFFDLPKAIAIAKKKKWKIGKLVKDELELRNENINVDIEDLGRQK